MNASLVLPARGRSVALVFLVGAITALALVGGVLSIQAFASGEDAHHQDAVEIGKPIATSFGSITFGRVETLGGLTRQDLGGMTHGIQNAVLAGGAQVEVSILVVNRGDEIVRVTPSQFSLAVEGEPDPATPSESSIRPVVLAAGASVEATLTFVVPQNGARMSVGYADPGGAQISVPAGHLGLAPAVVDDGDTHADDGHAP